MAGESTLVAKGQTKYVSSIKALGGASAYRSCGAEGGMKTATCLKALKAKLGTEEEWGKKWAAAMLV